MTEDYRVRFDGDYSADEHALFAEYEHGTSEVTSAAMHLRQPMLGAFWPALLPPPGAAWRLRRVRRQISSGG